MIQTTLMNMQFVRQICQFGKLDQGIFIIDPRYISATTELQLVFNTINWVFQEIS